MENKVKVALLVKSYAYELINFWYYTVIYSHVHFIYSIWSLLDNVSLLFVLHVVYCTLQECYNILSWLTFLESKNLQNKNVICILKISNHAFHEA